EGEDGEDGDVGECPGAERGVHAALVLVGRHGRVVAEPREQDGEPGAEGSEEQDLAEAGGERGGGEEEEEEGGAGGGERDAEGAAHAEDEGERPVAAAAVL